MIRLFLMAAAIGLAPLAVAQTVPGWASPSQSPTTAPSLPPDPPSPGPGGGPPAPVPIDGGLGLLALAGGAYAVRKIREQKA